MAVTLTEAAARHVARYIGKRGKGVGVRLGVKTTGCSGLAYKLEYADEVAPEDLVFEGHGVKVLVDPKSLPYLDGTELDFVREGLNEGFKFHKSAREGPLRLRRVVPRLRPPGRRSRARSGTTLSFLPTPPASRSHEPEGRRQGRGTGRRSLNSSQ